jgi:D-alanyl-D-alanine dipeptidase
MRRYSFLTSIIALLGFSPLASANDLPTGFVYLSQFAPEIAQDMRYAGDHNFVGRPIVGYQAPECILTAEAAAALKAAAAELAAENLAVRVYDCYRPARSVADFAEWARDIDDLAMQGEFYVRVAKSTLFDRGYIAEKSGHSRGSTVDLTIQQLDDAPSMPYSSEQELVDCILPERFDDGVLDFGSGYDCFDEMSHHGASGISETATANREKLKTLLERHGFKPYAEEWWHYTLANEPYPDTYFDFPVTAP